jgi:hypothetical protein
MTKKTTARAANAPAKAAKAAASTAPAEDDATPAAQAPAKSARAKAAPAKAASEKAGPETAGEPADGDADSEVPMNRAERRAKGRGRTVTQLPVPGKVAGGHGPAHTQRMWANRRSG